MNKMAKIILDCSKGQIPTSFAEMDKETRENAIRKEILTNVLGMETYSEKDLRRALRRNEVQVALFEIIEDTCNQIMLDGDAQKRAFYNRFVEEVRLNLGDKNLFTVEGENALIVSEIADNNMGMKRQRFESGDSFSLDLRTYGLAVFSYVSQLLSGRVDIATFVAKIAEAVDAKIAEIVQSTFATAMTSIPAVFKAAGTYNAANILKVCEHVEASNGVKPVLVGTASAIRKLQNVETIAVSGSDGMKDEINRNKYLPIWNGYEIVEIPQVHAKGTFNFALPEDKVYVLSGDDKLIKLVYEGDTQVKETQYDYENADESLNYAIRFKCGCAVSYNKMIGEISFTTAA